MARARKRRRKGARKRWRLPLATALLLLVALAAGWWWWHGQHWRPAEERWPDQGAYIDEADGSVRFPVLKGLGASFVYLEASRGSAGLDRAFLANLAAARRAGLAVGAVHVFDPCTPADTQGANFVTVVPREADLLPPAILLEGDTEFCPEPVSEAAIQSELMVLVNQIEAHAGKPVILAPSAEFEERYRVGARIERKLWLTRQNVEPTYAGRPWTLWTANTHLVTDAAETPLRWVVARP
ncbi:glycoside hydrolase family 25 protein [Qipengyuania sp.]|uniref:glycoside hydrolase family 25 protein n=1 Tax=Qipengyuania sp. TaxID=2004515 RepID=UPI0035C87C6F